MRWDERLRSDLETIDTTVDLLAHSVHGREKKMMKEETGWI